MLTDARQRVAAATGLRIHRTDADEVLRRYASLLAQRVEKARDDVVAA